MASIMGFQLKTVKTVPSRDGYFVSATMYLNGKKIGAYLDKGDGSCEDVNCVSAEAKKEMTKVIIEYAKEHPNKYIMGLYLERPKQYAEECERFKKTHPEIPDEDITIETMSANSIVYIVEALLNLMDIEKVFKKYQKKGYKAIAVDEEGNVTAYPGDWSDKLIRMDSIKNRTKLYMKQEDFCL